MKLSRHVLLQSFVAIACLGLNLVASDHASGQPSFWGLGLGTYVFEVAGDGSKAVGCLGDPTGNPLAGYWSAQTGWVSMDWGDWGTRAYAVSGDGSVITGYSRGGASIDRNKAYRWTSATGAVVLPAPANQGLDISADGTTIVGAWGGTWEYRRPFRHTLSEGTVDMSTVPGMPANGEARGVSGNGGLITGWGDSGGWLWDASDNAVAILKTASADISPWSLSADGKMIVGDVIVNGQRGAGYWRSDEGIVTVLPRTPGGDTSARDVTANGSMVTGYYYPDQTQVAWIWDDIHGVRSVKDMLMQDYGLAIGDWQLRWAYISDDGKTLAGAGINPSGLEEAWIAQVPEPATHLLLGIAGLGLLDFARRSRHQRRNPAHS